MFKVILSSIVISFLFSANVVAGDHGPGNGDDRKDFKSALKLYIEDEAYNLKNSLRNYLKILKEKNGANLEKLSDPALKNALVRMFKGGLEADLNSKYIASSGCSEKYFPSVASKFRTSIRPSASTKIGGRMSVICFDLDQLYEQVKNMDVETAKIHVASLAMHEHTHHFQVDMDSLRERNEEEAYRVAGYVFHTAKFGEVPVLKWLDPTERIAEIFSIGLSVTDFVRKAQGELAQLEKNGLGDPVKAKRDRDFCFAAKGLWGWVGASPKGPYGEVTEEAFAIGSVGRNTWPATYYANSGTPRCQKYHLKNENKSVRDFVLTVFADVDGYRVKFRDYSGDLQKTYEAGYLPNLPELKVSYQLRTATATKVVAGLEGAVQTAISKLNTIMADPSASALETCLASSVRSVIETKGEFFNLEADPGFGAFSGKMKNGYLDIHRHIYGLPPKVSRYYDQRLEYLAAMTKDWIVTTGGKVNICREFNLELRVDELSRKVEEGLATARMALSSAQSANQRLDNSEGRAMIRSGIFWGLTTLGALEYLSR